MVDPANQRSGLRPHRRDGDLFEPVMICAAGVGKGDRSRHAVVKMQRIFMAGRDKALAG
jgi:hypothetical protein